MGHNAKSQPRPPNKVGPRALASLVEATLPQAKAVPRAVPKGVPKGALRAVPRVKGARVNNTPIPSGLIGNPMVLPSLPQCSLLRSPSDSGPTYALMTSATGSTMAEGGNALGQSHPSIASRALNTLPPKAGKAYGARTTTSGAPSVS